MTQDSPLTTSFPDHFSAHAAHYARYRPTYPDALFDWIAASAPGRSAAWDCGCGNGQATLPLADRFETVLGTDPSAEQIRQAPAHPRIQWSIAPAEASGLAAASVDAIVIAQALHWFDLPHFWPEMRRVARLGAVVVAWSYGVPYLEDTEPTRLLRHLHDDIVGPYWPIERGHVDAGYKSFEFPLDPLVPPEIGLEARWTLDEMTGYLQTWSATRRYIKAHGTDPIPVFAGQLRDWWGERRRVQWPLTILAGIVQPVAE